MARPIHTGLDYFPFDGTFFSDIKIRKLIKYQGGKSVLIYIDLLCRIYGGQGYYILWDSELPFIISDDLGSGYDEGYVFEVIKTCVTVGLFDDQLFQAGVLTSVAIQIRYKKACETSKRKSTIGLYNLLEPTIPLEETPDIPEQTPVSSEETQEKSEEMQQSKVKENKVDIPPISNEIVPPANSSEDSSKLPAKPLTLEERKHEFGLALVPYVDKYGPEMIREFFDYWTEHNDGGKKMRWEIAKTRGGVFSIPGRLATWKKKSEEGFGHRAQKRGSTISEAVQATAIPEGGIGGQLDITKLLGQ